MHFSAVKFPLRTAWAVSHKFWHTFLFIVRWVFISLRFLLWQVDYVEVCCTVSQCFGNLPVFLLLLISSFIPLWWRKHLVCFLLRIVSWFREWSISVCIPCHLKGMCILILLHGVVYKCQLDPVVWCAVEFFYGVSEFLPSCSLNCQERGFEVLNYNYRCVYFSS